MVPPEMNFSRAEDWAGDGTHNPKTSRARTVDRFTNTSPEKKIRGREGKVPCAQDFVETKDLSRAMQDGPLARWQLRAKIS